LPVDGLVPGTGEGGAKAKDAVVVHDEIEVSESRRRREGDVGPRGVLELVAIRRRGAFGVTNWPGSGTETTRDLDTFAFEADVEALALTLLRTASGPEIVPRR